MQTQTLIIGGGLAGLSCAKKLSESKKDFLLITENIGGRILASADGNVNYGAYFVCEDYHHFLKYVSRGRKIKLTKFLFHKKSQRYPLLSLRSLIHIPEFIRLIFLLRKFKRHFYKFREASEKISQKQAIENDKFLLKLFKTKVEDLIKEHRLENLTRDIISQSLNSCTFSSINEMNAFNYLQFSLPLITPIYEFKFEEEALTADFKEKIIIDSVTKIEKEKSGYSVVAKNGKYFAKNIILATPIEITKKLIKLNGETNKPVNIHVFHIKGSPNFKIKKGEFQMFDPSMETKAIARQLDGTYLFCSSNHKPDFEKYFNDFSIIAHKFWNPVGNINGHNLLESKIDDAFYLAGDYNVVGLEDAFITGIYTANQII